MKIVCLSLASVLFIANCLLAETSPATVDEAVKVIDFSRFKLVNPVDDSVTSCIASQSYRAQGDVERVTQQISEALIAAGFKQAEGATVTPAYASALFTKNGFSVSLSIFPSGDSKSVQVAVRNLGNVDLDKLLVGDGLQKTYALPGSSMLTSNLPSDAARASIRKALESQEWEWFGDTPVSFFMRKNAVRLQVMANTSPVQPGTTAIQISSEQLSTQLPIPSGATMIQYADSNGSMITDSKLPLPELMTDVRERFKSMQWKCTTENPIKIGIHEHLIFRSEKEELADCEFFGFDGKSRCKISYQTKEQLDKESQLAKQAAMEAEAKAKASTQIKKVEIHSIPGAKAKSKQLIGIETKSGEASAVLKKWLDLMKADGWQFKQTVMTPNVADLSLEKDGVKLNVSLVDPGFIPGEIQIHADRNYEIVIKP